MPGQHRVLSRNWVPSIEPKSDRLLLWRCCKSLEDTRYKRHDRSPSFDGILPLSLDLKMFVNIEIHRVNKKTLGKITIARTTKTDAGFLPLDDKARIVLNAPARASGPIVPSVSLQRQHPQDQDEIQKKAEQKNNTETQGLVGCGAASHNITSHNMKPSCCFTRRLIGNNGLFIKQNQAG